MSYNFGVGFVAVPYQGQLFSQPYKWHGGSYVVGANFNWATYQTLSGGQQNIAIAINTLIGLKAASFRRIRSVYIDNLGSDVPIYVQFPDTQHTVVGQPNSADWYPAITNNVVANVFAKGLIANDPSMTQVLFSDADMVPYSASELGQARDLWLASASISRGTTIFNTNFGSPALGDQTVQAQLDLTTTGATAALFGPFASGFIYITWLNMVVESSTGVNSPNWVIESTGAAGTLYSFIAVVITGMNAILSSGGNIKIDATQTWRLRTTANSSSASAARGYCVVNYTTNPN